MDQRFLNDSLSQLQRYHPTYPESPIPTDLRKPTPFYPTPSPSPLFALQPPNRLFFQFHWNSAHPIRTGHRPPFPPLHPPHRLFSISQNGAHIYLWRKRSPELPGLIGSSFVPFWRCLGGLRSRLILGADISLICLSLHVCFGKFCRLTYRCFHSNCDAFLCRLRTSIVRGNFHIPYNP